MIGPFEGKYSFLSNFFLAPGFYDGIWYPTSEHAYQAAKTFDLEERKDIFLAPTPGKAKRFGKIVTLRQDWEKIKYVVMYEIVESKFRNLFLKSMLLETGSEELVEINNWNDTYWGVCENKGLNCLGKILMSIRNNLQENNLKPIKRN